MYPLCKIQTDTLLLLHWLTSKKQRPTQIACSHAPFSNKPPIVEAFTSLSNDTFLRLIDGKLVDPRVEINIHFDTTLNILPYKNGCVTFARDFFLTFLFFVFCQNTCNTNWVFLWGWCCCWAMALQCYLCLYSVDVPFLRLLWSFALRLLYKKNLTHSLPPHDNQHTKTLTHLGLCLEQILLAPPLCCCSGACMVTKLKVSDQKWRSAKSYIFILIAISLNAWAKLKRKAIDNLNCVTKLLKCVSISKRTFSNISEH